MMKPSTLRPTHLSLDRPHVDAFLAASLPTSTSRRRTRATCARTHGLRQDASRPPIIKTASARIPLRTRCFDAASHANNEDNRADPKAHIAAILSGTFDRPCFPAVDRIRYAAADSHRMKTRRANWHRARLIAPLRPSLRHRAGVGSPSMRFRRIVTSRTCFSDFVARNADHASIRKPIPHYR